MIIASSWSISVTGGLGQEASPLTRGRTPQTRRLAIILTTSTDYKELLVRGVA